MQKSDPDKITVWDVYNDITLNKTGAAETAPDSAYVQFVINRALSYHPDTILIANTLNRLTAMGASRQAHYAYANTSISPRRRMAKWAKKSSVPHAHLTEFLSDHLMISRARASMLLENCSRDKIARIERLKDRYEADPTSK